MRIVGLFVMLVVAAAPVSSSWGTAFSDCESGPAPMEMPSGEGHDGHHGHHGHDGTTGSDDHPTPPVERDGLCNDCGTQCDCSAGCSATAALSLIVAADILTRGHQRPVQYSFLAGPEPQVLFRPPIRL